MSDGGCGCGHCRCSRENMVDGDPVEMFKQIVRDVVREPKSDGLTIVKS